MPHHLVDQDLLNEERVSKTGITEIREGAWRFSSLPPFLVPHLTHPLSTT